MEEDVQEERNMELLLVRGKEKEEEDEGEEEEGKWQER